jgi:hypothetical protein
MKKLLISLLVCIASVYAQSSTTLTASPPDNVGGISANRVGNQGNTTYYYWVVSNWGVGQSSAAMVQVSFAPDTLSGSNYIAVSWNPNGALSYDVLRTKIPSLSASCICAVSVGLTTGSVNDTGGALNAYTYKPVGTATTNETLVNSTYPVPVIISDTPLMSPAYLCVGTPGNTIAPYKTYCGTTAGGLYICSNSAGCKLSGDWTQTSGGGGGGGGTPAAEAVFNTTTGTCTGSGSATACTASNTCGVSSQPCLRVTTSFDAHATTWSIWDTTSNPTWIMLGGTDSPGIVTAIDGTTTIVTFTFSAPITAGHGYIASANNMGPTGSTGATGANGIDGTNGVSVTSSVEPPGVNCTSGGTKLVSSNGTTYACNGLNTTHSFGATLFALNDIAIIPPLPYSCTSTSGVNSWTMSIQGAGTATVDIARTATTTAIPSFPGNSITASAAPAIAANSKIISQTMTGWCGTGTCTFTAHDSLAFKVTALSGPSSVTISVECQ